MGNRVGLRGARIPGQAVLLLLVALSFFEEDQTRVKIVDRNSREEYPEVLLGNFSRADLPIVYLAIEVNNEFKFRKIQEENSEKGVYAVQKVGILALSNDTQFVLQQVLDVDMLVVFMGHRDS